MGRKSALRFLICSSFLASVGGMGFLPLWMVLVKDTSIHKTDCTLTNKFIDNELRPYKDNHTMLWYHTNRTWEQSQSKNILIENYSGYNSEQALKFYYKYDVDDQIECYYKDDLKCILFENPQFETIGFGLIFLCFSIPCSILLFVNILMLIFSENFDSSLQKFLRNIKDSLI